MFKLESQNHLTATERRHIKQGLEQGLEFFGTKRKFYAVIETTGDTVKIKGYNLPLRDPWGKPTQDWTKAYPRLKVAATRTR